LGFIPAAPINELLNDLQTHERRQRHVSPLSGFLWSDVLYSKITALTEVVKISLNLDILFRSDSK